MLLIEENLRRRQEHLIVQRVPLYIKSVDAKIHLKSELVFEIVKLLQLREAL